MRALLLVRSQIACEIQPGQTGSESGPRFGPGQTPVHHHWARSGDVTRTKVGSNQRDRTFPHSDDCMFKAENRVVFLQKAFHVQLGKYSAAKADHQKHVSSLKSSVATDGMRVTAPRSNL